jgi:hypothetical protein
MECLGSAQNVLSVDIIDRCCSGPPRFVVRLGVFKDKKEFEEAIADLSPENSRLLSEHLMKAATIATVTDKGAANAESGSAEEVRRVVIVGKDYDITVITTVAEDDTPWRAHTELVFERRLPDDDDRKTLFRLSTTEFAELRSLIERAAEYAR